MQSPGRRADRAPDPDRARRVGHLPRLLGPRAAQDHAHDGERHPQEVGEGGVLQEREPGVACVIVEAALAHLDPERRLVERLDLRVLQDAIAEVQEPAGQVALVAVDEQALVVVAGLAEGVVARQAAARDGEGTQKSRVKLTAGVPSGFEDLLAAQTQVVDIYFGGRNVGSSR